MQLDFEDSQETAPVVEQINLSEATAKRVHADDKRMINATTDVNQLVPFKYKWAWDRYLTSCNNHWMPQEKDMTRDAAMWASTSSLSEAERQLVLRNLGSMVLDNVAGAVTLGLYRHITAPEARQYLLRQGFEEAISSHVYSHVVTELKIDEDTVFQQFNDAATIHAKRAFLTPFINTLTDPKFKTGTIESDQMFVKCLVVYACLTKSVLNAVDAVQMMALGKQGKLTALSEQYALMLRDQTTHCEVGMEVVQSIKMENRDLWTPIFKAELQDLFRKAVDLEIAYAQAYPIANSLDLNPAMFANYIKVVANLRASQIGLGEIYPPFRNPLAWMADHIGLKDDNRSIESKVESQTGGGLSWD